MYRLLFILPLMIAVSGCGRPGPAPASTGPAQPGFINPAGLTIPATAVDARPTNGYWNCGQGLDDIPRAEHVARCTLDPDAPYYENRWGF